MSSPTSMPPLPDIRPRWPPHTGPPPRLWSPPPDPDKPACPYRPNFTVEIKRHIPPPPFGDPHYGPGTRRRRSDVDLYKATQTQVVMEYPPLESPHTLPSPSPSPSDPAAITAKLTILSELAVEDGRGPQLVVCSVAPDASPDPTQDGPPAPYEAVAKIFDPLYYSFQSQVSAHVPVSVAWRADVHYTHEAAALDYLAKKAQTSEGGGAALLAPQYFGSWAFTLPITYAGQETQRSIRLVLMEHIHGPSLRSICLSPSAFASYTEQDRLTIFATILDGFARQWHTGLDQRDLAARNIVLRTGSQSPTARSDPNQPLPQPVLVDYNIAVVFNLSLYGKRPCQLSALPPNPMQMFWGVNFPDFGEWTPAAWNGNDRARQEWLMARFGGEGVAERYAPVDGELEFAEHSQTANPASTSVSSELEFSEQEQTANIAPAMASTRPKGAKKRLAPPPTLPLDWKAPPWPIKIEGWSPTAPQE